MTKDVSSCTTATAPIHRDQAAVTIHCKDYAAWTALHVTLLKNNQAIHDQPITVTLPLDTNGDRSSEQSLCAHALLRDRL